MSSKTGPAPTTPLWHTLPNAQFAEHHCGIVDAPIETVWRSLHALRWTDLTIGRPLVALRGLNAPLHQDRMLETFTRRAGAVLVNDRPHSTMLVMIGKPWSPIPQHIQLNSVAELESFRRPGWLKYGMEWELQPLADGRTVVETRTLCEATDPVARRRFRLYWSIIRAGSGAIRLDIISTLRRLSTTTEGKVRSRPWT